MLNNAGFEKTNNFFRKIRKILAGETTN